jgi:hypothetical protein
LQRRQDIKDVESAMDVGNPDHFRPGAIKIEDVFSWHIEEPEH